MKPLVVFLCVMFGSSVSASEIFVDQTHDLAKGQFIVVLSDSVQARDLARNSIYELSKTGTVKINSDWAPVANGLVISGVDDEVAEEIAKTDGVKLVAQDFYIKPSTIQVGAPQQLDRLDQNLLPLNGQFSYQRTGAGFNTYVIDGGIRTTHQEFGGRADNIVDLTSNGPVYRGTGTMHGTGVAAIIAGATSGVAKQALVHGVVVNTDNDIFAIGDLISGMNWVVAHGVHPAVVNLSWNPLPYSASNPTAVLIRNATNALIGAGFFVSNSIGNAATGGLATDGCSDSISGASGVFVVAGAEPNDHFSTNSDYGWCVSGIAEMYATTAFYNNDTTFIYQGGTSFSAPVAAGLAAVYWAAVPGIDRLQIISQIQAHCYPSVIAVPAGTPNCMLRNWL